MAILGVQLVLSLIMFSFLQKLGPYYSFGRWLLCNRLVRYLHPTDEDLKKAAGIPQNQNGKSRNKRYDKKGGGKLNSQSDTFTVPRSTEIHLETAKVEAIDLVQLHFYQDFQWLLEFAVCALVVYIVTEIYFAFLPRNELNISVLWCLLVVIFCFRILISQAAVYFRSEEGGERILCVTFGFFFLVFAMGILVVDEKILEFGLVPGYNNFSEGAESFLKQQGINSQGPISLMTFKIILAIICSVSGALLTFPGLRYAKVHLDTLKYVKDSPFKQALLHINFILPLVIVLLWVKPIGRDIICAKNWQVNYKLLNEDVFEVARLSLIIVLFILRLVLMPPHMQAHLNLAYDHVQRMKKETGRISNLDLQRMIARVFYYLCVVAIQYILPCLLLLFMVFLQKTLGDYSWSNMLGENCSNYFNSKQTTVYSVHSPPDKSTGDPISDTTAQFTWAITNLRQVFSPTWYQGLFGFLTWWMTTAWFSSTAFGIYYYSRVATQ